MDTLVLIGFLGGLITGISPCILPVLPVIFFSGTPAGDTATDTAATPAPQGQDANSTVAVVPKRTRYRWRRRFHEQQIPKEVAAFEVIF